MSGGRMRAMGSALFLKNRYGAGYQLQLLVNPAFHTQVSNIVKQLLPGCEIIHGSATQSSSKENDERNEGQKSDDSQPTSASEQTGHGNIVVTLKRSSLRALPQFFKWVEGEELRWRQQLARDAAASSASSSGSSPIAASQQQQQQQVLREWSLSNSTLEEVFLRLCAHEKDINASIGSGSEKENESAEDDHHHPDPSDSTCMLCHTRPPAQLITLYSKSGQAVDFENLLCGACAHTPEAIQLVGGSRSHADGESSQLHADEAPIQLSAIDTNGSTTPSAPLLTPTPGAMSPGAPHSADSLAGFSSAIYIEDDGAAVKERGINNDLNLVGAQEDEFFNQWDAIGHIPPSLWQQVRSIFIKNASLLGKQRKSVAGKIVVLALFLFLVLFFTSTTSGLCPQGWQKPDKNNFYSWGHSLSCNVTEAAFQFAISAQAPAIPFGNTPHSLDIYDCQYMAWWPRSGWCGWSPRWAVRNKWIKSHCRVDRFLDSWH